MFTTQTNKKYTRRESIIIFHILNIICLNFTVKFFLNQTNKIQSSHKFENEERNQSKMNDLEMEIYRLVWQLHLAFFAPLKCARFDANARRTLLITIAGRWSKYIVGATDQLSSWIETIAKQTHSRICCDAAAFGWFSVKEKGKKFVLLSDLSQTLINSITFGLGLIPCCCPIWFACECPVQNGHLDEMQKWHSVFQNCLRNLVHWCHWLVRAAVLRIMGTCNPCQTDLNEIRKCSVRQRKVTAGLLTVVELLT